MPVFNEVYATRAALTAPFPTFRQPSAAGPGKGNVAHGRAEVAVSRRMFRDITAARATWREPIDSAARGTPSRLAHFAMDAQKPDNGARLSHNARENFFLTVNYLTLPNRFPERPCLRVGGSALIWRMLVKYSRYLEVFGRFRSPYGAIAGLICLRCKPGSNAEAHRAEAACFGKERGRRTFTCASWRECCLFQDGIEDRRKVTRRGIDATPPLRGTKGVINVEPL